MYVGALSFAPYALRHERVAPHLRTPVCEAHGKSAGLLTSGAPELLSYHRLMVSQVTTKFLSGITVL